MVARDHLSAHTRARVGAKTVVVRSRRRGLEAAVNVFNGISDGRKVGSEVQRESRVLP